ncbi:MAG TPA: hypothetical protein VGD08_00230 [Stellaceae bacterium]|jgi:hypothetical protein
MTPQRAKRIIRLLGWSLSDFIAELNRVGGTAYRHGDVWKWFSGVRSVPLGVAIFLRLTARIAVLERRYRGKRSACAARNIRRKPTGGGAAE